MRRWDGRDLQGHFVHVGLEALTIGGDHDERDVQSLVQSRLQFRVMRK